MSRLPKSYFTEQALIRSVLTSNQHPLSIGALGAVAGVAAAAGAAGLGIAKFQTTHRFESNHQPLHVEHGEIQVNVG